MRNNRKGPANNGVPRVREELFNVLDSLVIFTFRESSFNIAFTVIFWEYYMNTAKCFFKLKSLIASRGVVDFVTPE